MMSDVEAIVWLALAVKRTAAAVSGWKPISERKRENLHPATY
jgi:hypothetical protein